MTCASCVQKVERALERVSGVGEASVNLATRTATVRGSATPPGRGLAPLVDAVRRVGYDAHEHTERRSPAGELRAYGVRLAVACAIDGGSALAHVRRSARASWNQKLAWVLTTPVVFFGGWPFLHGGVASGAPRFDHDGHARLARGRVCLRLQRGVGAARTTRPLLRRRGGDRDPDPRRQGVGGPGPLERGRRVDDAARAQASPRHRARRRRRTGQRRSTTYGRVSSWWFEPGSRSPSTAS